ncbi:MAG: efflux RND transporter periplasmic adaptor subunit [Burkholderiaceae bacterium]|nr:efflux RND transporter periplasmic adaptor subunit [Burkholderiaceae bacterium]
MNQHTRAMPPFATLVWRSATVLLVAAILWGATRNAGAQAAPGPEVKVTAAQLLKIGQGLDWDGALQPVRQSTLAAQTQARVLAVKVRAGDRVRAGQVLVSLDNREAAAGVRQSSAQEAQVQAALDEARAAHARNRRLLQQGFISQAAMDAADAQLRQAEAQRSQAGASSTLRQLASSYATLVAPYDGVVTAVMVERGELAAPGRPLVELHGNDRLRALAYVPASVALALGPQPRVTLLLPAPVGTIARRLEEVVGTIVPSADPSSATVELRVDLPAEESRLFLPGQRIKIHTSGAAESMLVIPRAALLMRGELQAVYVAAHERFVLRAVRLGRDLGERVEVLAGLRAGEKIALDPVRAGLSSARPAKAQAAQ